ncbi:hypothetical protein V6N11_035378 [Hibiscus sabdariffa]|uniref:Uncharacterized protein n=1 Tax=Hibiscus sabdariffa TaxID=183260 RepID=A0ABR2R0W5_9ROSI
MVALSPDLHANASAVVTEDVKTLLFAPSMILQEESQITIAIHVIFNEALKDASQFTLTTSRRRGPLSRGVVAVAAGDLAQLFFPCAVGRRPCGDRSDSAASVIASYSPPSTADFQSVVVASFFSGRSVAPSCYCVRRSRRYRW